MLKKSLKIFYVAILCATFSCAKTPKDPHIISSNPEIQLLERQDHKFCDSLDLNSGSSNKSFNSDLYWRCRLSMAKYKLKTNVRTSHNVNFNALISDLVTKISLHLSEARESVFIKENKKIDAKHHAKCVSYGLDFDLSDRLKTDQYLLCRKRLIDEDQLDPAYGVDSYLKYPNRSYNLSFVLDNRIDVENKRFEEAEKNYPSCTRFFKKNSEFKKCTEAQDQSRKCFLEVDGKKFKKESEQKTICQRQAYVKFPDSFLKEEDQRKQDIARTKTNADAYNSNNFAALGILDDDVELFESEETADAEYDAREKQKKIEKNINSKRGLYTRYELIRLRQKYIVACQQSADYAVQKYVEEVKQSCADIGVFKANDDLI